MEKTFELKYSKKILLFLICNACILGIKPIILFFVANVGLSKIINIEVTMNTVCGTPGFCGKSPRILW